MRNTVRQTQAKVHPVTASISVKFWEMKEDTGISGGVPLSVLLPCLHGAVRHC